MSGLGRVALRFELTEHGFRAQRLFPTSTSLLELLSEIAEITLEWHGILVALPELVIVVLGGLIVGG